METRTLGIEEELLVVDPITRSVTPGARHVLREHAGHDSRDTGPLDQELFGHQLETRTEPASTSATWLPVLLAMSADSPYAGGRDTGDASWRTQQWSSWPSAGPTEAFGSVAGYRQACARMIASGAARDPAMLYFDARLSVRHPTLEVRVLDAVTDVDDAGLLAALVRGLVETAAIEVEAGSTTAPAWRSEELRAARWRASRHGLAGRLLDPVSHGLRPARAVVVSLVDHVGDRLEAAGDAERVTLGVERVLAGTGAVHQRAAHERTGSLEGVVDDLLERTTASWARA